MFFVCSDFSGSLIYSLTLFRNLVFMKSTVIEIINSGLQSSNVRMISKNDFGHLIRILMSYLSPTNSPKDANYEKEIIEIFDQLQQFIQRDFPINRRFFT